MEPARAAKTVSPPDIVPDRILRRWLIEQIVAVEAADDKPIRRRKRQVELTVQVVEVVFRYRVVGSFSGAGRQGHNTCFCRRA